MNRSSKTFQDYSNHLMEVYGQNDQARSLNQIWLRIVHRASELGETVRESREENITYDELMAPIADVFCWVNNFVSKCNSMQNDIYHLHPRRDGIDIDGKPSWIIWEKYPGLCPTCNARNNPITSGPASEDYQHYECECFVQQHSNRNTESKYNYLGELQQRAAEFAQHRPKDVDQMVAMFDNIYGNRYPNYTLEMMTFHFLEEVGEVTEQLGKLKALHDPEDRYFYDQNETSEDRIREVTWELRREIADVYSWISALIIYLNNLNNKTAALKQYSTAGANATDTGDVLLSKIIDMRFQGEDGVYRCPTCNQRKCDPEQHEMYW